VTKNEVHGGTLRRFGGGGGDLKVDNGVMEARTRGCLTKISSRVLSEAEGSIRSRGRRKEQ